MKTALDRLFVYIYIYIYIYLFQHKLFQSQMVSFDFCKMTPPFSVEGDVIAWLKKVDLVANLEGIPDGALLIPFRK